MQTPGSECKTRVRFQRALILLVWMLGFSAFAYSGGVSGGGGGDAIAQEFVIYGQAWDRLLSSLPERDRMGIDAGKFHRAVYGTLVRSTEHVQVDGEVDAKNEAGRITVSRSRWSSDDFTQRSKVALHEFLGTMNLDRHYEISGPFVQRYSARAMTLAGGGGVALCGLRADELDLSRDCPAEQASQSRSVVDWTVLVGDNDGGDGNKRFSMPIVTSGGLRLDISGMVSRSRATLAIQNEFSSLIGGSFSRPDTNLSDSEFTMPEEQGFPEQFKVETSTVVAGLSMTKFSKVLAELSCREVKAVHCAFIRNGQRDLEMRFLEIPRYPSSTLMGSGEVFSFRYDDDGTACVSYSIGGSNRNWRFKPSTTPKSISIGTHGKGIFRLECREAD